MLATQNVIVFNSPLLSLKSRKRCALKTYIDMPSLREAVKLNTFKNTRVNFQYVGVFHLSLCIYVAIRSFHFKVHFVRHIYIPKSAHNAYRTGCQHIIHMCF